jgi:hypothetical protein
MANLITLYAQTQKYTFEAFKQDYKNHYNFDLIAEDLTPQIKLLGETKPSEDLILKMDRKNPSDFYYFCYLFQLSNLSFNDHIALVDISGFKHGPALFSTLDAMEKTTHNFFTEFMPILEQLLLRESGQDLIDCTLMLSKLMAYKKTFLSYPDTVQARIIKLFTDGNFDRSIER